MRYSRCCRPLDCVNHCPQQLLSSTIFPPSLFTSVPPCVPCCLPKHLPLAAVVTNIWWSHGSLPRWVETKAQCCSTPDDVCCQLPLCYLPSHCNGTLRRGGRGTGVRTTPSLRHFEHSGIWDCQCNWSGKFFYTFYLCPFFPLIASVPPSLSFPVPLLFLHTSSLTHTLTFHFLHRTSFSPQSPILVHSLAPFSQLPENSSLFLALS